MSDDRPADRAAAPKRRGLDGRTIGGRYRVLRTVSAGANTLIAEAGDLDLDRVVTIKLVRPELSESEAFRRHFRRQMDEMTSVSHPNLAAVYDWGEEQIGRRGTVYVVVEHLAGGSMRDLFDRGRNLTPSQALMVGLDACRGLDFAHRKGLVHTELTPSKLVFGDDRRLRIVDFGLARLLGEQDWKEPSQVATHVARYASPEQAEGKPLDGHTDVYSLALILVEAVTGNVPFVGDSTVSTLSARLGRLMPVSADLGPLAAVLERAGRPEASERFSASQFGRALVRTAEKLPRPTPIPIVVSRVFADPSSMRAPNDPTGGIAKPAQTPGPALVAPAPLLSRGISPGDVTVEVTDGPTVAAADVAAPTDEALAVSAPKGVSDLRVPPLSEEREVAGQAPTDDDATGLQSSPGGDEFGGLPGLAERTPKGAPTADPDTVTTARRGGVGVEASVAATGRRGRRREAKEQKRAAKEQQRAAKARLAQAKAGDKAKAGDQAKAGDKAKAGDQAGAADKAGTADKVPVAAPPPGAGLGLAAPAVPAAPLARRRRRWVPWFAGLFLLAVLGGLGYLAWILFRTPTHEIPAVVGLPRDEALALVDDFEWEITVDEGRSDEYRTPGEIILTSPSAGVDLAEGSPLLLVVSEGPEFRSVPDVSGLQLAEAQAEIEELELVALPPTSAFSEDVPEGVVISAAVDGAPVGGDVLPGAEVQLVVSDGPQPRRVPQLRGLTAEEATQLLDDLGLVLEVGETVFDDEVPAGGIATQSPAVDSQIARDGSISVEVSKGPDLVTFPDLTGMTLPEIGQALEDAGLRVGNLLGSTRGTFVAASIDGDEVEAGEQVRRNSAVNIIILV